MLPGDETDEQARYLEVEINATRLINIYAPNGNPVPGDKYDYKLRWMARLHAHLKSLRAQNISFAIGGDFNIIPEEKDCWDPKVWIQDALFRIESRYALRTLLNLGLTDAFRVNNTAAGQYTFWDYQAGCWPKNFGIRIDHFLLSPQLADRLVSCTIDTGPRNWDKPSDHTPIIVEIRT
jgi:exodeoxyribonuclease-3